MNRRDSGWLTDQKARRGVAGSPVRRCQKGDAIYRLPQLYMSTRCGALVLYLDHGIALRMHSTAGGAKCALDETVVVSTPKS